MATPTSVTQILCFSPSKDILSVSNCWVTWLTRFDIFAHASGCTDDRHILLLHTASEEVQDISATLADKGATYDEAVAVVNAQFQPQVKVTIQRHVFRHECQKADEMVLQFEV